MGILSKRNNAVVHLSRVTVTVSRSRSPGPGLLAAVGCCMMPAVELQKGFEAPGPPGGAKAQRRWGALGHGLRGGNCSDCRSKMGSWTRPTLLAKPWRTGELENVITHALLISFFLIFTLWELASLMSCHFAFALQLLVFCSLPILAFSFGEYCNTLLFNKTLPRL